MDSDLQGDSEIGYLWYALLYIASYGCGGVHDRCSEWVTKCAALSCSVCLTFPHPPERSLEYEYLYRID